MLFQLLLLINLAFSAFWALSAWSMLDVQQRLLLLFWLMELLRRAMLIWSVIWWSKTLFLRRPLIRNIFLWPFPRLALVTHSLLFNLGELIVVLLTQFHIFVPCLRWISYRMVAFIHWWWIVEETLIQATETSKVIEILLSEQRRMSFSFRIRILDQHLPVWIAHIRLKVLRIKLIWLLMHMIIRILEMIAILVILFTIKHLVWVSWLVESWYSFHIVRAIHHGGRECILYLKLIRIIMMVWWSRIHIHVVWIAQSACVLCRYLNWLGELEVQGRVDTSFLIKLSIFTISIAQSVC